MCIGARRRSLPAERVELFTRLEQQLRLHLEFTAGHEIETRKSLQVQARRLRHSTERRQPTLST
jgi:hypothetical protein